MSFTHADAAKNHLSDKYCNNCSLKTDCKHTHLRKKFSTCQHWKPINSFVDGLLRVVRLSYPNSISGDIFNEFAMEKAKNEVFYLKPVYKDEDDEE